MLLKASLLEKGATVFDRRKDAQSALRSVLASLATTSASPRPRYGYDEIAEIVGKSEANCRQVFARARKNIDSNRPRFTADRDQQRELAAKFFAASMPASSPSWSISSPPMSSSRAMAAARAAGCLNPSTAGSASTGCCGTASSQVLGSRSAHRAHRDHGEPGALCFDSRGKLINVLCLDISNGVVNTVCSVINPDKLVHLGYDLSELGRVDPAGQNEA
jgi:RNA polymerase sigma-70 factor (ECF subfamily)